MAAFQLLGNSVYREYQQEGDNGFKHTYRRGVRKHAILDTITEGIGVNNVRILPVQGIAQKEILIKTGIQQAPYGKYEQYQYSGPEHGKKDVPYLFQPSGSVHLGGFEQLGINGGNGGQVHDGIIAHILLGIG